VAFADLDGDGDMDAVLSFAGTDGLHYYENAGSSGAPIYEERFGAEDPFAGISGLLDGSPFGHSGMLLADLDQDGDIDLAVGTSNGSMRYWRNEGTSDAPIYVERTGLDNPFDAVLVRSQAMPTLGDMDNDGDRDLLVGGVNGGRLYYYQNVGSDAAPVYVDATAGSASEQIVFGSYMKPTLGDVDGDGDLDLIVGEDNGGIRYFINAGSPEQAVFVEQTGFMNPFDGIALSQNARPVLVDMDGDGDLDLVISDDVGEMVYVENTTTHGATVTIGVVAQPDGPTAGADVLNGTGADDTIDGLGGNDTLNGAAGNDFLDGGAGDDTLNGGDGDDYLRGGLGADIMTGGDGADTYVVDNPGDTTIEAGGRGGGGDIDTVWSNIGWTLEDNVENLVLGAGAGMVNGIGNALDNAITGNAAANILMGLGGSDTLIGGSGHDTIYGGDDNDVVFGDNGDDYLFGDAGDDALTGGAGNDVLDGGVGADTMAAGAGNDTYIVDDVLDVVVEGAVGGGVDTIQASVTLTMADNVEKLILTGSDDLGGTGNALANTMTGNIGDNILSGGGGADILFGGDGDDILNGDAGTDHMTGGAGADTFVLANRGDVGDRIFDLNFAEGDTVDLRGLFTGISFVTKFTKAAGQATLTYDANLGYTYLRLDVNGDGKLDYQAIINGNHSGDGGNLYTGAGDLNGGWIL